MPEHRWKIRRKVMFSALAFCGAVILAGLWADGLEATTREAAITQGFWAGAAIIGSYVFGATWDDKGRS